MSSEQVKILIVDDQPENLMALEAVLGELGEQIVKANNGKEALKHLLDQEFAIILLDIKMPGMTGYEIAELIRTRQKCRYTPIIFLTAAYTEDIHEAQGYALGAVDFITKPLVPDILRSKVSVFVELYKKSNELKQQNEIITQMERKRLQEARERLDTERQLMKEELLRKEAERALLLERSLQLQKSEQLKTEFLANMSHEIRTPMHGIVGFIELLTRTELTTEQQQYADFISSSAQSLLTLINDILDLSKVEAGKLDLETVEFDLRAIVEGTAALVAESIREKNLSLMTFVDPQIPPLLKGDPGRLRQILLNLMSNAVKFTEKGEVVIRCQLEENDGAQPNASKLIFSVTDTGIGIDKLQIDHLFKPFSQADGSTTRRYGGTGLGLSISKRLVELMGGEIGVDSELGKGSTFWFKIQLPVASSSSSVAELREAAQQQRVLVIDDHASARRIMQTYIQSWNMSCDVAMDATEGLDMMHRSVAEGKPYNVVITDLVLPGMDGFKLKEEMLQDIDLQKMKTVLVTGYDLKDQGKAALQAGFAAYLTKPLEQSRLFNALSHVLVQKDNNQEDAPEPEPEAQNEFKQDEAVILLAEDNPVNQKVAVLQLGQLGFKCQTVNNGKECVDELAKGQSYALVFMDCQMPEMDGFQATKEIRDAEVLTGTHIPIIGLTAYAMEGDRDRCIAAGMDDYVSKPSSFDKLAAVLKRWLPQLSDSITEKQKLLPKRRASA